VLGGVELACERAREPSLELIALDAFAEDREQQAVANARRPAEDGDAIAYLGDFTPPKSWRRRRDPQTTSARGR
jgi:hypothetical protein